MSLPPEVRDLIPWFDRPHAWVANGPPASLDGLLPLDGTKNDRNATKLKMLPARYSTRSASKLTELDRPMRLFTMAPLYVYGGRLAKVNFLEDFATELNHDLPVYFQTFQTQIVDGFRTPDGDQSWNHSAFMMPTEYWPAFLTFMTSVTLFCEKFKVTVFAQTFEILDPVYCDKHGLLAVPPFPSTRLASFGFSRPDYSVGMGRSPKVSRAIRPVAAKAATSEALGNLIDLNPYWLLEPSKQDFG